MINKDISLTSLRISIVGLGLIGGSLAKAIKHNIPSIHISAFDKPDILKKAKSECVIDVALSNVENCADSDIIFLSLPTNLSLEYLTRLAPLISEKSLITDVSGVKSVFYKQWNSLEHKGFFIGGHPMTGKEKGEYENSDAMLFENSVYVLTGTQDDPHAKELIMLLKTIGARIILLSPEEHDKIVASVSHLPQLTAVSLINALTDEKEITLAAGGFRDLTRVASSPFKIWKPVIQNNKKEILESLARLDLQLKKITNAITTDDNDTLQDLFDKAANLREAIPKNSKGFIHPLHDLFIYVNDEPGVLAKLTGALFNDGINIKDIELLKIREGTGGTFRASFENREEMAAASTIIKQIGFKISGGS
ncbi:MAG: prephenate dehydrogenase/arogenate dehydrogenase family protein [Ignavibacteriaceae bacterium]|nr:prephenate dehydrogenase/arogenate dehydrogenase family protein [Ignavibacteriaceae bacterium]